MSEKTFVFCRCTFNEVRKEATFVYNYDEYTFQEKVVFANLAKNYNKPALEKALFLAFLAIGTSYYKAFPTRRVAFQTGGLDKWQANFANNIYQEGLSQFAYENNLKREDLAFFQPDTTKEKDAVAYAGSGILALQSGGKDSLLLATLLQKKSTVFTPWYLSSAHQHPGVLDELAYPLHVAKRCIDHNALGSAKSNGALNGHVPVTFIVLSIALIEAILNDLNTVLVSIGHEGEESHALIGNLPITHQWSKTWPAEEQFAEYVRRYISPDIRVGSPLRQYSELRVAELFAENAWSQFGKQFSSCNRANYKQGTDNTKLAWCGECSKCANAFLLFASFIEAKELKSLFDGKDLFSKPLLAETFKGLLGVDGVMKPFECVGEIDELRLAYHKAQENGGYEKLPFEVPMSHFDYLKEYPSQEWTKQLILQSKNNTL